MEIEYYSNVDLTRMMLPYNGNNASIVVHQTKKDEAERGVPPVHTSCEYSIFDNKVCVGFFDQACMILPRYKRAVLSNEMFNKAGRFLSSWPEMYVQVKELTKVIQPFNDTTIHPEYIRFAVGSSSSSKGLPFGYMCVTVDNAIGLAQAIVHELAHHKLRFFGIDEDNSHVVFADKDCILSPLDITRNVLPVMALHDIYTYQHILQLNIEMIKSFSDYEQVDYLFQLLFKNTIRMEYAYVSVIDQINTITPYTFILEGLKEWIEIALRESKLLLSGRKLYNNCWTFSELPRG